MITGLLNLTPEGFSLMKKRLLIFLCTKGLRKGWVIWLKRLLYLRKMSVENNILSVMEFSNMTKRRDTTS
jgi:hypothetical protein